MSTANPFPSRTPRLSLPYLFPGQTQREFYVNESLGRLDMLVHTTVEAELPAPPPSPDRGLIFIVASPGSGVWEGLAGQLAQWDGQQWAYAEPLPFMQVYERSTKQLLRYDGAWIRARTPPAPQGGTTVDAEARAALGALVVELRRIGIFA